MKAHELGEKLLAGPDYVVLCSGGGFEAETAEVGDIHVITNESRYWYLYDRWATDGVVELDTGD